MHAVLFVHTDDICSARAMLSLAPLNFLSALLVLIGGFLRRPRYACWAVAFAVQIVTPSRTGCPGTASKPGTSSSGTA